jgi:glycosyltransferase involved in cell wall biosynthesis
VSDAEAVAVAAQEAFESDYAAVAGRPVCVVIAALDEVDAVASVVSSIPARVGGLDVECIVVDDGSTDGTDAEARRAGALVCRLERNLGQGRALRCGYRLAAARGCRVIVTMDADGQFDVSEIGRLAEPVLEGRADMVNGSRRLGSAQTTDRVRAGGVVLFGALVSVLTGTRITDPANGFRAFRPEVCENVPLRQPQYQTAELLIGALSLGYRVVEAPVTVRARAAGQTKKGRNLVYGYRFGRVVLGTWWSVRKGRPARARPRR